MHRSRALILVALVGGAACAPRVGFDAARPMDASDAADAPTSLDARADAPPGTDAPAWDAPAPACAFDARFDPALPDASGPRPVDLALGDRHSCARLDDGTLRCWGSNSHGQLGDGTSEDRARPTLVAGLAGVASVAAGVAHTCALTTGGAVLCWGANDFGQLGDGTHMDQAVPTAVALPGTASQLAVGGVHSCARLSADGALWCWGRNSFGQLGNGSTTDARLPTRSSAAPAASLALGAFHTCSLGADGTVQCWGDGTFAQLGDCVVRARAAAASVPGVVATHVSAGARHVCAIAPDASLHCWGSARRAQLGFDPTATMTECTDATGVSAGLSGPATVPDLMNVAGLALGAENTCALTRAGEVLCWGANRYGESGACAGDERAMPGAVTLPAGVSRIALGAHHGCALAAGHAWCWGDGQHGQLGDGTTAGRFIAAPVRF